MNAVATRIDGARNGKVKGTCHNRQQWTLMVPKTTRSERLPTSAAMDEASQRRQQWTKLTKIGLEFYNGRALLSLCYDKLVIKIWSVQISFWCGDKNTLMENDVLNTKHKKHNNNRTAQSSITK